MGIHEPPGPGEEKAAGVATDGRDFSHCRQDQLKAPKKYSEPADLARFSVIRHGSFLQVLASALASDQTERWHDVRTAAKNLLTVHERASLGFATMRSLPPDEREATAEAAFFDAHRPPPLLGEDVMAEARLRAVASTTREVKAAMAAGWEVLDEGDRNGFLARIVGRSGFLRHVRRADADTLDALGLAVARAMTPARWRQLVDHMKKRGAP